MNLAQPAHKYLFADIIDLDLHMLKVGIPVVFGTHGAEVRLPKILELLPVSPASVEAVTPNSE